MTRDDLEAVIWRHWPARGPRAGKAVDAILAAADSYRDGTVSETPTEAILRARRRTELTARPLHYIPMDGEDGDEFACHPKGNATGTTALADVTCRQCLSTDAYKNDLALTGRAS